MSTATARPWATSSDGDHAQTTPMELAALGEHAAQCTAASGRLTALHCASGRLLVFAASHLVTTGAVLVAVGATLLMWL